MFIYFTECHRVRASKKKNTFLVAIFHFCHFVKFFSFLKFKVKKCSQQNVVNVVERTIPFNFFLTSSVMKTENTNTPNCIE